MSELLSQMRQAAQFLEEYPKLETASDLASAVKSLNKNLGTFLRKAEDLKLEQIPGYSEVAALLEGEGKPLASLQFMTDFCRLRLKENFNAGKADKKARSQFLKMVAAKNQLAVLKKELDPNKKGRELFDGLVRLDLESIRTRLAKMNAKDLTLLVKANGLTAARTSTGLASKSKKSIEQIVSQFGQIKLTEHF